MAKSKSRDTIHTSQEPHQVEFKLTDEKKAAAALVLANAHSEVESLTLEKKASMAEYKQRADKLSEKIHVTSLMVQKGVEMRSVSCKLELNYTTCRAKIIRSDNHQVIEEREMTLDEKQMQLEYDKPSGKNKKKTNTMEQKIETEQTEFEKARAKQQAEKDRTQSDNNEAS